MEIATVGKDLKDENFEGEKLSFEAFRKGLANLALNSKANYLAKFTKFLKIAVKQLIYRNDDRYLYIITTSKFPFISKAEIAAALTKLGITTCRDTQTIENKKPFEETKSLIKDLDNNGFSSFIKGLTTKSVAKPTKSKKDLAKAFARKLIALSREDVAMAKNEWIITLRNLAKEVAQSYELE